MAENYFGITDTGRLRENNEDAFIAEEVMNGRFVAACVIDGVGGYEGGEVAARLAQEAIRDYFTTPSGNMLDMLKEAIAQANEKIQAEKLQKREYQSMACVLTLALADIANNLFFYAHVGDTRLYLLRGDSLVKVTKDHSFVGFLEDSGRLPEEQAMQHPKRNEINKALGFDTQIRKHPDYIETGESPFLPGDMLLLCSDGLTDLVTSREITAILTGPAALKEKGAALIDAANNKGGKDNITVVLVQNHTAQAAHQATRPAVAVKKNDSPKNEVVPETVTAAVEEKEEVKPTSAKLIIFFLSLLCCLLLGALLWLWFRHPDEELVQMAPASHLPQSNPAPSLLTDTLNRLPGKELLLADSLFPSTIILTKSILLQKDSLHLHGKGNIVLKRDSAFTGPAFIVPLAARRILLENLTLEDFDVGIQVQGRALRLKNVRFINCRIPVQYGISISNNKYVTGKIGDTTTLKTDSLPR